jgi:REP element-mobilizing transposase RayT
MLIYWCYVKDRELTICFPTCMPDHMHVLLTSACVLTYLYAKSVRGKYLPMDRSNVHHERT